MGKNINTRSFKISVILGWLLKADGIPDCFHITKTVRRLRRRIQRQSNFERFFFANDMAQYFIPDEH